MQHLSFMGMRLLHDHEYFLFWLGEGMPEGQGMSERWGLSHHLEGQVTSGNKQGNSLQGEGCVVLFLFICLAECYICISEVRADCW